MTTKSILEIDLQLLKLKRQKEELYSVLSFFMPVTFSDICALKDLSDDEVVKLSIRGDNLKQAIAIWEKID